MSATVAVVYRKGALWPLRPLNLPENTQLEIKLPTPLTQEVSEAEKAYQVMLQAGLIQPSVSVEREPAIPASELQRVADAYGQTGPLSELIIAERNEP